MKKTLSFPITLLLLLFIVACGGTTESTPRQKPISAPAAERNAIATTVPSSSSSLAQAPAESSTSTSHPVSHGEGSVRLDMDQRIAIFKTLWEKVDDEYVDPKFNGVNWKKVRKTYASRVKKTQSDVEFHNLMRQMIGELRDRHSAYYSPEEAWDAFKLTRGGKGGVGLGVSLLPLPEEKAAIVQWAIPGNAAANAGIRSGDLILAVDGQPVCCDANGNLYEALLLNQSGSRATLTVKSDGQSPREVTVTRKPLVLQDVVEGDMLPGGVAYIRINTFLKNNLAQDFEPVWQRLATQNPRGLILDLRTNGGGLKYEAMDILAYFLPDGEYGYFQSRKYDAPLLIHKRSKNVGGSQSIPLAVLVDETTASIAEVFALVLQETGRARVFGNPTAGNVEVTRRYDLPAGAAAQIAVERYISPKGHNIEGRGLTPDVDVDQRWRDVSSPEADQALQAAIKWIAGGN